MAICGEDNPQLTGHWETLPRVWRTEEMPIIGELFFFFFEKLMHFFPTVTTRASQPSDGDLLEEKAIPEPRGW